MKAKIKVPKLPKIDGKTVKDHVEWLKANDCGCCRFHLTDTENYRMHISIGWHDYGEGHVEMSKDGSHPLQKWVPDPDSCRIAWKIGMETFNNAMQCDFDVDFFMPDDGNGNVYDTLQEIEGDSIDWDALAAEMNETAEKVYKWQLALEESKKGEGERVAA